MQTVKIQGKDYVEVKERVLYLAEAYPLKYSIQTKVKYYPNEKMWVAKATLTIDGMVYTGHAQEIIGDGYINKTSALENAETSAVGRACAMAGIGVIGSIASADEIHKAQNRQAYLDDQPIKHTAKAQIKSTAERAKDFKKSLDIAQLAAEFDTLEKDTKNGWFVKWDAATDKPAVIEQLKQQINALKNILNK